MGTGAGALTGGVSAQLNTLFTALETWQDDAGANDVVYQDIQAWTSST